MSLYELSISPAFPFSHSRLINLNQRRPIQRRSRNIHARIELRQIPRNQSADRQSPWKAVIEREWRKEISLSTLGVDVRNRNRDRRVLARYIRHANITCVNRAIDAKPLRGIHFLRYGLNGQGWECC